MKKRTINQDIIMRFSDALREDEKSNATIRKYTHDVNAFSEFLGDRQLNKHEVISYKKHIAQAYAPTSVNSMLVSINSFLEHNEMSEYKVKLIKIQRQLFINEKKELETEEYKRLLMASYGTRMELVLQTICETGIRVSELEFITVEAVKYGKAIVDCKNKTRVILIPSYLRNILLEYADKVGIKSGVVFVTRSGKPLNRSNIWRDMKVLCTKADIDPEKVYPHNLRHLFARTFYSMDRDIVRLADMLGHSSINTTRIYTVESGKEHVNNLEKIHDILMT